MPIDKSPAEVRQELFTKSAAHLLTQYEKSVRNITECLYRGPDGLMCAVGCLIDNHYYDSELEKTPGIHSTSEVMDAIQKSNGFTMTFWSYQEVHDTVELLNDLQVVHDSYAPDKWEGKLKIVALKYQLEMPDEQ